MSFLGGGRAHEAQPLEGGCGVSRLTFAGAQVAWFEPAEIKRRYPLIDAERCVGGTMGFQDGTMDPHAVLMAYKNKAVDLGAHFIKGRVAELVSKAGNMTGVKLADGCSLHGNAIVTTAGAWAPQILETIDISIPIQPVKRQVFVLETAVQPDGVLPLIVLPSGLYLVHVNTPVKRDQRKIVLMK